MKLKFSFRVIRIILLFVLLPGKIQLSFFDALPLEITQNILVYATPQTRVSLFSTCHGFTESIDILKPTKMKKIIESVVRQNIFKGNFGKFEELDRVVKNQLPKIILNDNPAFKSRYDEMWILYSFRYVDIMRLGDLSEKFPPKVFKLKSDMFEMNEKEMYKIFQFTYQENDEIIYQTIYIPEFNLTSDLAWSNIKIFIQKFPKLERIIVNDIQIKDDEIEKNYPLQYRDIIIQNYPKTEEGKPYRAAGITALHFPEMGYKAFKLLLENNLDPNVPDRTGDTPLHLASLEGKLDIVKLLLEYGADPYFKNHMDFTPADRLIWYANILKENGRDIKHLEETIKFWQNNYLATIGVMELPKIMPDAVDPTDQAEPGFSNNFKKYAWIAALVFVVGGSSLGFFKLQQYLSSE